MEVQAAKAAAKSQMLIPEKITRADRDLLDRQRFRASRSLKNLRVSMKDSAIAEGSCPV